MASFTNFATLSYNGGTTNSNTVTGELLEVLTVTKTAVVKNYAANDKITYIISIVNSGAQPVTNLTVTDNLGAYEFNSGTVYPLAYVPNSVRYYVNGVLQTAPTATPEPPLVITVPNVPANGSIMLVYEAEVTAYAPLGTDGASRIPQMSRTAIWKSARRKLSPRMIARCSPSAKRCVLRSSRGTGRLRIRSSSKTRQHRSFRSRAHRADRYV